MKNTIEIKEKGRKERAVMAALNDEPTKVFATVIPLSSDHHNGVDLSGDQHRHLSLSQMVIAPPISPSPI